MDFLLELGFDKRLIKKIEATNNRALIFNFVADEKNATSIIKYLQEVGVTVIDQLLVRRLEFFSIRAAKVKSTFENYDTKVFVQLVSEDINVINFL